MVGLGYAQNDVPKEITRFLETQIEVDNARGLSTAKRMGYIHDSVKVENLRVGRILQGYKLKHVFLDAYPDTIPFSEIIEPSGYWFILIIAHDKPVYELYLDNSNGEPKYTGRSSLQPDGKCPMWSPLLEAYPEETGINPVIFSQFGSLPIDREDRFLYFKQKGPRKIHHFGGGYNRTQLNAIFSNSIETLDDSKKLIEFWKKQGLNEVGITYDERERRRNRENKSGGGK